jgi:hypothetical protein
MAMVFGSTRVRMNQWTIVCCSSGPQHYKVQIERQASGTETPGLYFDSVFERALFESEARYEETLQVRVGSKTSKSCGSMSVGNRN